MRFGLVNRIPVCFRTWFTFTVQRRLTAPILNVTFGLIPKRGFTDTNLCRLFSANLHFGGCNPGVIPLGRG
jgi:hypothetical protein